MNCMLCKARCAATEGTKATLCADCVALFESDLNRELRGDDFEVIEWTLNYLKASGQ